MGHPGQSWSSPFLGIRLPHIVIIGLLCYITVVVRDISQALSSKQLMQQASAAAAAAARSGGIGPGAAAAAAAAAADKAAVSPPQRPCPGPAAAAAAGAAGAAPCGCDRQGKYNLSHLTQEAHQAYKGPVQDDEALFLFSLVRAMRMSRVLEVGGKQGYSGQNFLEALSATDGKLYTVDIRQSMSQLHPTRHKFIVKDAGLLTPADVDNAPLDLVFFDCHVVEAQMKLFDTLWDAGIITNRTVLALHDTNTHPTQTVPWAYETEEGWVHSPAERKMVHTLHVMGWDAFMLHTPMSVHSPAFPYRHGVVIMSRYHKLTV